MIPGQQFSRQPYTNRSPTLFSEGVYSFSSKNKITEGKDFIASSIGNRRDRNRRTVPPHLKTGHSRSHRLSLPVKIQHPEEIYKLAEVTTASELFSSNETIIVPIHGRPLTK